jgi:gluconate kinase
MVIFFAGLVGSGKSTLGKIVADEFGLYYYDIDQVKKEIYPTDPNYEFNLKYSIPFSDETRARVFHRVVEDFPNLLQKHEHIVVDEVLHKESLRKILFEGAKKYFGDYIVIWVNADEEIIKKRLKQEQREGHILNNPLGMYLSLKKKFEDFNEKFVRVSNNKSLQESKKAVTKTVNQFIEGKLMG